MSLYPDVPEIIRQTRVMLVRSQMQAPATAIIEAAIDGYKYLDPITKDQQVRELRELDKDRIKEMGASGYTKDFVAGYMLGLQTARSVLAGSSTLFVKNIDPEKLL